MNTFPRQTPAAVLALLSVAAGAAWAGPPSRLGRVEVRFQPPAAAPGRNTPPPHGARLTLTLPPGLAGLYEADPVDLDGGPDRTLVVRPRAYKAAVETPGYRPPGRVTVWYDAGGVEKEANAEAVQYDASRGTLQLYPAAFGPDPSTTVRVAAEGFPSVGRVKLDPDQGATTLVRLKVPASVPLPGVDPDLSPHWRLRPPGRPGDGPAWSGPQFRESPRPADGWYVFEVPGYAPLWARVDASRQVVFHAGSGYTLPFGQWPAGGLKPRRLEVAVVAGRADDFAEAAAVAPLATRMTVQSPDVTADGKPTDAGTFVFDARDLYRAAVRAARARGEDPSAALDRLETAATLTARPDAATAELFDAPPAAPTPGRHWFVGEPGAEAGRAEVVLPPKVYVLDVSAPDLEGEDLPAPEVFYRPAGKPGADWTPAEPAAVRWDTKNRALSVLPAAFGPRPGREVRLRAEGAGTWEGRVGGRQAVELAPEALRVLTPAKVGPDVTVTLRVTPAAGPTEVFRLLGRRRHVPFPAGGWTAWRGGHAEVLIPGYLPTVVAALDRPAVDATRARGSAGRKPVVWLVNALAPVPASSPKVERTVRVAQEELVRAAFARAEARGAAVKPLALLAPGRGDRPSGSADRRFLGSDGPPLGRGVDRDQFAEAELWPSVRGLLLDPEVGGSAETVRVLVVTPAAPGAADQKLLDWFAAAAGGRRYEVVTVVIGPGRVADQLPASFVRPVLFRTGRDGFTRSPGDCVEAALEQLLAGPKAPAAPTTDVTGRPEF